MPASGLSAIEAVIAEAFPELKAAAEMAPPTTVEPLPAPAAEATPEPGQNIAEPIIQDAAADAAQAAPEPATAPVPEIEPAPEAEEELVPVNLDAEFDTEEFLFGEGAAETDARTGLAAETPAPIAAAAAPGAEAATAAAEAEKRPDPLIPIKAMSPEERIALFS